jgi:hypothetical protein
MTWTKNCGVVLLGLGIAAWLCGTIGRRGQAVFSSAIVNQEPFRTNVTVSERGTYGLYLRFDGLPDDLGLSATQPQDRYRKQIDYPLRLEVDLDGSPLIETNIQKLEKAKEGNRVVFYALTYLPIEQHTQIAIFLKPLLADQELKRITAGVELDRPAIAMENRRVIAAMLAPITVLLSFLGMVLIIWPKWKRVAH